MSSFWTIDARQVVCVEQMALESSTEFDDLVMSKKHQQGPHAIPCQVLGTKITPVAKQTDVVAAQSASRDIVCHFSEPLSPNEQDVLRAAGARRMSSEELEKAISSSGFLRQIITFPEKLPESTKVIVEELLEMHLPGCVRNRSWDLNTLIVDVDSHCQVADWGRVFRLALYEIHDSISPIRSFQGKRFEKL